MSVLFVSPPMTWQDYIARGMALCGVLRGLPTPGVERVLRCHDFGYQKYLYRLRRSLA